MISYQSQVTIARPPEEVWPYLIQPDKQALWSDVPMRKISEGPWAQGTRFEVTFGKGPLSATIGLELTAAEPGRRMAWTSYSGPVRWAGEYRLAPMQPGGTELSQEGSMTFTGLWRLLEPFVGAEISRGEVKKLEKLKSVVEAD